MYRLAIVTAVHLASITALAIQAVSQANDSSSQPESVAECSVQTAVFPLRDQDLTVISRDGAVLFEAGMTIDADGAPNAYGPHNRGLDYTANARGVQGWVSLVTDRKGHPIVQKGGPYRGYYVSTTSLQQGQVHDSGNPRRYVDATDVPYIALPSAFAAKFDIHLGDLAVVVNQANGRAAYAVFADVGPKGRIGEGSIALARQLGIPSNPRHDSATDGVTYLVFPGSALPAGRRITALRVRSAAAQLYQKWLARTAWATPACLVGSSVWSPRTDL